MTESAAPSDAVVVDDLVKRYKKNPTPAVDGVSFAVHAGEVFGLLGPNGAGKTTTIGVLTTRVLPTSGRAYVMGVDVVADPVGAKRRLAVVPQRNNLDRSLSIRQNLLFHAQYHGVPRAERVARADDLLERFGLADRAGDKVEMFSGGQMQRVMIARALMHAPDVLFLDEPTTGLDPAARLFLWDQIRDLRAEGRTVVLTTHDMEEAAALCDRVGIVDKGHLLVLDTPEALRRVAAGAVGPRTRRRRPGRAGEGEDADPARRTGGGRAGRGARPRPGVAGRCPLRVYLTGEAADFIPDVTGAVEAPAKLSDLRTARPSLEDVFLHLTGRAAAMSRRADRDASRSRATITPARVFWAVLKRDLFVTGRDAPVFFAQVILQPLFLLFVFGRILSDLGFTRRGYSDLLFPGIVAFTATLTGLQSTSFPLVIDFSWTKEIEDRLLAPMPIAWVALEKIVFAAMRALIAAAVMFPVGVIVLGSIPWRASGVPLLIAILLLGALVGSALGLVLGTFVPPSRLNIVFALVLTPLLFTGCSQYPWPSLAHLGGSSG